MNAQQQPENQQGQFADKLLMIIGAKEVVIGDLAARLQAVTADRDRIMRKLGEQDVAPDEGTNSA